MREAKTFRSAKADYTLTQFGALEGQRVLLRLSKFIGPAIGRAAVGAQGNLELGPFLEELFTGLDDAMVEDLAARFAKYCMFKPTGEKVLKPLDAHYDDFFAGQYVELMFWFRQCLEANFADFLEEMRRHAPTAQSTVAPADP